MSPRLDKDEIEDILEAYDEEGSKKGATEEVDFSRATVRKYVDKHYEEWKETGDFPYGDDDDDGASQSATDDGPGGSGAGAVDSADRPSADDPAMTGGSNPMSAAPDDPPRQDTGPDSQDSATGGRDRDASGQFTSTPPGQTPLGAPEEPTEEEDPTATGDEPDFEEMGYGEFIGWFFDQNGHGVNSDFAQTMSDRCRVRQELPDENTMKYAIKEGASGVNNDFNCEMIAENYWAAAQKFMRAKQQEQRRQGPQGPAPGGWQNPQQGQYGQGPQGQQRANEWVSPEQGPRGRGPGQQGQGARVASWQNDQQGQGQYPQGQGGQGRYGQQGRGPGGPGGPPGQQNGQQGGESEEMQQMKKLVKGLYQTQQKMMKQMQGQQDQQPEQERQSAIEQLRELRKMQEEAEALTDDGSDDEIQEVVGHFNQKIQQLQQQVAQQETAPTGDESEAAMFMKLATQDGVDPEMLSTIADATGQTDPEVKKAEIELEKEDRKAQRQQQILDSLFDNVGEVAESVTGAGIDALFEDDDEPEVAEVAEQPGMGQQPAQPGQPGQQAADGMGEQIQSSSQERFEELQSEFGGGPDDGDEMDMDMEVEDDDGEALPGDFEEFAQGDDAAGQGGDL